MIYDELIEELALTLLTKARYEGCISVIDGFSQCEEDKTRIEYPIDGVMRIMPVGSEIWPEECEPLLKKIGAETIGDVADYLNKSKSENSSADDVLFTALLKICYENMPDEIRRMRDDECLLLMRSEDPVIDKKYNLLHHPNVKYTPDAGGEPYVMPPDYMGDAVTITMDAVAAATAPEITEEMYEQLDYLEKHPEENYYENEENFSQYDQGD